MIYLLRCTLNNYSDCHRRTCCHIHISLSLTLQVVDLMYFVVILLVFIVAYGVASQAILFPNTALSPNIILDVLRRPYWQMYGELFLEDIEGSLLGSFCCILIFALICNNHMIIYMDHIELIKIHLNTL